jgi:protein-S-isoprenylcysteine O-methyltransferase Ste14
VGLAFATVELPYLVDGLLQSAITTPALDSHADDVSRLKTELFIAHYHLRLVGYVAFALLVGLIVAGFTTRHTGLATLGALGLMLTVFAQFAAVMFFLAGLGALNVLWLPVLDLPVDLPALGRIIRAPYDGARWALGAAGVENSYWPVVLFCIASGLLVFFLGTLAWLSARARGQSVARSWVYRISRHPQYLGWIVWSYGVYLLLLRGHYPRRSWGIDASLPWLVAAMVILGVALVEEMNMRRLHGEAYEGYRRSAPFLFPLPAVVEGILALPLRAMFGKDRFERSREVAAVLGFYTALLMGASAFFYGPGLDATLLALSPSRDRETAMTQLAREVRDATSPRTRYFLARRLGDYGEPAVPHLLALLEAGDPGVRSEAAAQFERISAPEAGPALVDALGDRDGNVRWRAAAALASIPCPGANEELLRLLDVEEQGYIRHTALGTLARRGVEEVVDLAAVLLDDPDGRTRHTAAEALGALGSERGVPVLAEALDDESPRVRRAVVVALLQIGSPLGRQALVAATDDEDWEVRLYAAEALKRLPGG